jgi:hypothetical protein
MPLICPQPGPRQNGPDCPLYAQRVGYGVDEPLRRAILTERPADLTALIRADAIRPQPPAPSPSPTQPGLPRPTESLPIFDHLGQREAKP